MYKQARAGHSPGGKARHAYNHEVKRNIDELEARRLLTGGPVVLLTCGYRGRNNIMPVAYAMTASITPPSSTIRRRLPCATPSSMIAALTVGRYNDASVLMS